MLLETKRFFSRMALLLAGCCLMTACSLGDTLMGVPTNYTLDGTAEDPDTEQYLQKILSERLAEKTKSLVSEEEESSAENTQDLREHQESYIEYTVQADLLKALHAKGYYDGQIEFIDGEGSLAGQYKINYGAQYKIGSVRTDPADYNTLEIENPLATGDVLDAEKVITAQRAIRDTLSKDRCYFDLSIANRVTLNRTAHTADIEFVIDAGAEGKFGALTFEGNNTVKESYLRKLIRWREGECFRRETLERYKTTLIQSGLFSQADFILPENGPLEDGSVPATLKLTETVQRTVSAGLTFYSDEGPGAVFGWEHRNFFGEAEKLKATLQVSSLKQSLGFDLNKPFFIRRDQNLSFNTEIRRQDTDAYEELALDGGVALTRNFGRYLKASTGVKASVLRITDHALETTSTYGLVSAPQNLTYDTRDDVLDPKKGVNLALSATPFFDVMGEADPFFKTQFTGSGYLSLGNNFTFAAKGSLGSIWGAEVDSVPATERFFAGGGGTIRGYGYQEIGPKENDEPSGGLSVALLSLELRSKFTDTIGAVAFVDTGSVSEESTPDFNDMAVGAGLGLRYFTSFGPVRFDIATPLTQKEDLDQNYQFYISIGQAF